MRRYIGDERYSVETIGVADDLADADGVAVLTFFQAQSVARNRAQAVVEEARVASLGPAVTVGTAIDDYLSARENREAQERNNVGLKHDARSRLTKHVGEQLAATPLAELTTSDLAKWRGGLAMAPSSVQRTVNDLKAALNCAARSDKAKLPPAMRETIMDGLASMHAAPATAREAQVLPDESIRAIVSAAWEIDADGGWEGALGRLVVILAATGARFSQVIRMTVADVQKLKKRLMIPVSRKGRGNKASLFTGVRVGDDVFTVLDTIISDRANSEVLLLRPRREQVGVASWKKVSCAPWHSASELARPWALIVDRAGLDVTTVPYALRHSSIARGLRAGLPLRLVAAIHDSSSAMIEQHYSRYIVDAMDQLAARAIIPLTSASGATCADQRESG